MLYNVLILLGSSRSLYIKYTSKAQKKRIERSARIA